VVICSDHGTAYGEDGYTGHRLAPLGCMGCALRRVHFEGGERMIATELHPVLQDSAYRAYVYAYPHKTAYRPFAPIALSRSVGERTANGIVPVCACAVSARCGGGFLQPVHHREPEAKTLVAFLSRRTPQASPKQYATQFRMRVFARFAIGGGTPTYLNEAELAEVFDITEQVMGREYSCDPPVGVETSPDTLTAEKVAFAQRARRGIA